MNYILKTELLLRLMEFYDYSGCFLFSQIARDNARPVIPSFVNHHLQRIIDICWNADPNKRPRFEKIAPILDKLEVS